MVFRSKIDRYFSVFLLIIIFIFGMVMFIPLVIEQDVGITTILTMSFIWILIVGFVLWSTLSIKYVFKEDHLLIKGGPFKSEIPYDKITEISPTTAIFTGYRIMSAKNGLELFSDTIMFGSVKISPKERALFLSEVKKYCPNVTIQD